jgi:hypothetical protein
MRTDQGVRYPRPVRPDTLIALVSEPATFVTRWGRSRNYDQRHELGADHGELTMPNVTTSGDVGASTLASSASGTHLTINASFDSSVTSFNTPGNAAYNPTLYQGYVSAVQTAVQFYENTFSNPITINLVFGWGEVDGEPVTGFAAESKVVSANGFSYAQVYNAVKATDIT